jgi:hypothetical protein
MLHGPRWLVLTHSIHMTTATRPQVEHTYEACGVLSLTTHEQHLTPSPRGERSCREVPAASGKMRPACRRGRYVGVDTLQIPSKFAHPGPTPGRERDRARAPAIGPRRAPLTANRITSPAATSRNAEDSSGFRCSLHTRGE